MAASRELRQNPVMAVGRQRRRRGVVGSALLGVLAAGLLAGCGGGAAAGHNPGELFPDRSNQYREDQEREIGDAALLSGYTTTVTDAVYEGDGVVTISVRIENRDDEPQDMRAGDWQLVSPGGNVYDPDRSTLPTTGKVGDEPVTGDVGFLVDELEVTGDFYIIYKPDALDAARGIWQLTNP